MRNKIQFLILMVFVSGTLMAGHVPSEKARLTAKNFYFERSRDKDLKLSDIKFSNEFSISYSGSTVLHVFNLEGNRGWLVVSAEDQVFPVLSYSFTGHFIENDPKMPPAYKSWLDQYKKQIKYVIDNHYTNATAVNSWEAYSTNYKGTKDIQDVGPLLDPIAWDQIENYNDLCPQDVNAQPGFNGRCPTGCVATAMSQIMKFWGYPATGQGQHSYAHPVYGNQSANFGTATYKWDSMPPSVTSANAQVAKVLYHAGVSVDMNYAPDGSGATMFAAKNSLQNYFKYASEITYQARTDTTPAAWKAIIKSNIDAHRPIMYSGEDSVTNGGHAFILDGYQGSLNDHYHFNWGWSGTYNGYNYLSSIHPDSTGAGGGSGDYTANQDMIYNIHPAADYYPVAGFYGNPLTVATGSPVSFTDTSTAPAGTSISGWKWYFSGGNPSTSTQQNPTVTYSDTGTYNVALKVISSQGSDSIMKTDYITVVAQSTEDPVADFTASAQNREVGQSVDFFDQSSGNPYEWHWTFESGSPSSSTDQNPVGIVYNTAGDFNVTLVVKNTLGYDTLVKTDYIHIVTSTPISPVAEFTADSRLITTGTYVNFTDSSLNTPLTWYWEFPGGTPSTSNLQHPTGILYDNTSIGFHDVTLTVTNNAGFNSLTKTDYILVTQGVSPNYCDTLSNITGSEGLSIHVTNVAGGYVAGKNSKGIKYYAERFINYTASEVSAIEFSVGKNRKTSGSSIKFHVWGGTSAGPSGSPLPNGTKTIPMSGMTENWYSFLTFDAPVQIPSNGIFFVGFEVINDTFALNIVNRNANGSNTLYVLKSAAGSSWQTCKSLFNFGASMDIMPYTCLVDVPVIAVSDNIRIYPNPANDFLMIDFDDMDITSVNFSIYDLMGREVKIQQPQQAGNRFQVETTSLRGGLYLLNINSNGKTYTKRISIMR